jgi:hypothetical protein
VGDGPFEYIPRKPEETVLYGVIAEELETFLSRRQEIERPIPRFVEKEFRDYLTCGILEHGFIRVHCDTCGHDRAVPYSCYPQWETICSSNSVPKRRQHKCMMAEG